MGLDVYAYRSDGTFISRENMTRQEKCWFTKASKDVCLTSDNGVDGYLKEGSLDCTESVKEVCKMLGISIDHEAVIPNSTIKERLVFGRYSDDFHYQSAVMFLLGCIRFKYDIRLNW
jgi:hypothetical protein